VPVLPPDRPFLPWRRGVKHAVRPLAATRPVAAAFFFFFLLTPRSQLQEAGVKAAAGGTTEARLERRRSGRSLALTQERPEITLRSLCRRKKKSRSNRQPRAAARGRPPLWCPAATAGGQGKEHAPATGARPHTARPVKDRSYDHGAQRPARGVGARCPHAERQPTPAPRQAQACASCPPARTGPATEVRQH
jgi:hypothetical protein